MGLSLTLAVHPIVIGGLIVLGIAASVLLILTILVQRPQGGGLAAAFGGAGAGSGQTAFGAKTGDALTIMTIVMFVLWLLISIALVHVTKAPSPGARGAEQTNGQPAEAPPASETTPEATPSEQPAAENGQSPTGTTETGGAGTPPESGTAPSPAPVTPPVEPASEPTSEPKPEPEPPSGGESGGGGR